MKKVKVQLVKYDMSKTKNRNRKDMLVDNKSEAAVITQLERIHKGEQVVKIHQIVWDEKQIKEVVLKQKIDEKATFYGEVKYFDAEKGFGFIQPDGEKDDIFFHKNSCVDKIPLEKDKVEFKITQATKGLSAIHVKIKK